jgi:chromosome segregation ATPase
MSEFDIDSDTERSVSDVASIGSYNESDDDAAAAAYISHPTTLQPNNIAPKPASIKSNSVRHYTVAVTKQPKCKASGKGQKCNHDGLKQSINLANGNIEELHAKLVESNGAHRKSHDELMAALNARERHTAAQERSLTSANKKRNEQEEKLNKNKRELMAVKKDHKKTKEELKDTTRALKKMKKDKESADSKLAKAQEDITRMKMETRTMSSKPSKMEELEIERQRLAMKTKAQMAREANTYRLKAEAEEKKDASRRKKYIGMTSGAESGSWCDKVSSLCNVCNINSFMCSPSLHLFHLQITDKC